MNTNSKRERRSGCNVFAGGKIGATSGFFTPTPPGQPTISTTPHFTEISGHGISFKNFFEHRLRSGCAPTADPWAPMRLFAILAAAIGLTAAIFYAAGERSPAKPVALGDHSLAAAAAPVETSDGIDNSSPDATTLPVTIRSCADQLVRGLAWLNGIPQYTAVFRKQERIHGELHLEDTIHLKLRHAPYSVAMDWDNDGRIVYYTEGRNQNRLTVRMGGWRQRLGWVHLDPHSRLALGEARYPVTDTGILRLAEQLLERFEPYLDRTDGVRSAWLPEEQVGDRRCRVFVVEYADPTVNPDYRKSVIWLDTEWSVPLAVQNFDWQTDDASNPEGLVEYYAFEDIALGVELRDSDFTAEGIATNAREVAETEPAQ